MKTLSMKVRVILVIGFLALLIVAVGWLGYQGMAEGANGLRDTYQNEVVQFVRLDDVYDVYGEALVAICHKALAGDCSFAAARAQTIAAREKADQAWRDYLSGRLEPKEQVLADEIVDLKVPLDAALLQLMDILEKADRTRLESFHTRDLYSVTDPICDQLNVLCRMQKDDAARIVATTERTFALMKSLLAGSVAAGLLLAALLTVLLIRMLQGLRDSEAGFRALFESHHSVMLLFSPESGAIADANSAAATFFGYAREDLLRMNAKALNLHPLAGKAALTQRRLPGEDGGGRETSARLANGKNRRVEVHSSSILLRGKPLLFCIIHDITDRKTLETDFLERSELDRELAGLRLRDSLGGTLAGAAMAAKALSQTLAKRRRSQPEAALAGEVVKLMNAAITQSRSISRALCPVGLDASGLTAGLRELATSMGNLWGVRCHCQTGDDLSFHSNLAAVHLYRIAQEAVHNAIEHGHARNVTIDLAQRDGRVVLKIQNDGAPLPENLDVTESSGLRTMLYRANAIGGLLEFNSALQGGVQVTCTLPGEILRGPEEGSALPPRAALRHPATSLIEAQTYGSTNT